MPGSLKQPQGQWTERQDNKGPNYKFYNNDIEMDLVEMWSEIKKKILQSFQTVSEKKIKFKELYRIELIRQEIPVVVVGG